MSREFFKDQIKEMIEKASDRQIRCIYFFIRSYLGAQQPIKEGDRLGSED